MKFKEAIEFKETKEAIEFCERLKDCDKTFSNRGCKERLCKIQKLLQQGEKYKVKVKELIQEKEHWRSMYLDKGGGG